jgi:CrcB protein
MNLIGFLAVGSGGLIGCVLRWWLGMRMNTIFPALPLGTLAANLIGGYIIGLAAGAITENLGLSPTVRLFLMPGFCGGLTTFSTFSLETTAHLMRGQIAWGLSEVAIHVCGSLLATTLGILSIKLIAPLLARSI